MKLNKPRYKYTNVSLIDVYDGDTITLGIDLGFKVNLEIRCRFARINAWEVKGEEKEKGLKAKEFLINEFKDKRLEVETYKDSKEKFGRYLVEIFCDGENVNDLLVTKGHAHYQEY